MKLKILGIVLIIAALVFGAIYGSKYFGEYLHKSNSEEITMLEQKAKEIAAEAKQEYLENTQITSESQNSGEEIAPIIEESADGKIRIVDNDVVAKITITACNIDLLVYENEEDDYYLRRDADGKSSRHGEIYTNCYDCDVPIIYGHHMTDGTMFASLDNAYIGAEIILEDIGYLVDETRTYTITSIKEDLPSYKVWDYLEGEDGDLVLITCSYGIDDGRLIIIANEKPAE